MPTGIGIRLTIEGPVFVDSRGMTLYRVNKLSNLFMGPCDNTRVTSLLQGTLDGKVEFTVTVPNVETRKTCAQKRPSVRAPANAQPAGKWTIQRKEDGSQQWVYGGHPLYTSIKDKVPGDINGSYPFTNRITEYNWLVASAPLVRAPPGISIVKLSAGLVLVNYSGKALYYKDSEELVTNSEHWEPLITPALAVAENLAEDWSIQSRNDGLKQWAYRDRALYTYVHDSDSSSNDSNQQVIGDTSGMAIKNWHIAVLKAAPGHPSQVTVKSLTGVSFDRTWSKRVYADQNGMTLYTIHCVEDTTDRLDCDDLGDSPRYWFSFCGGADRCAKTWHPLEASADAESINNIWSVIVINPIHPWQPVEKSNHGIRIWAYRGRPVFTTSQDSSPGDYNGETLFESVSTMMARTIPAYANK